MPFKPTENLDTPWYVRQNHWPHISHDARRRITDVPPGLAEVDITDRRLDNDPGEEVRAWAETWVRRKGRQSSSAPAVLPPTARGLLLMGEPGRGKTTHACAAANHVSDLGWSTKFLSVANWHQMALTAIRMDRTDADTAADWWDALDAYERAGGWSLLVLDDLGKEHRTATDYAKDNLDRLIRNRYTSGVPTIITTNFLLEEISVYGESMASFINEAFTIVDIYDRVRDFRRPRSA